MVWKLHRLLQYPWQLKHFVLASFFLSLRNEIYLKLKIYKPIKSLHFTDKASRNQEFDESKIPMLQFAAKSSKLLEKYAPWRPKCYNRALTIKQLLKKREIHTDLHIGFRKKDGVFDGHAWITYHDKIVTGLLPRLHSFSEFDFSKEQPSTIE